MTFKQEVEGVVKEMCHCEIENCQGCKHFTNKLLSLFTKLVKSITPKKPEYETEHHQGIEYCAYSNGYPKAKKEILEKLNKEKMG